MGATMAAQLRHETRGTLPKQNASVQLITFKLDDQEYALEIANVVQVIRMVAVNRLPQTPDYMEGVINLRGKVIPVVDIRKRCGLPPKPYDANTQLLIAQSRERLMALIVDTVSEVLSLPQAQIETPDRIAPELPHLWGVGKLDHRLILLLDPNSMLPYDGADAPARFPFGTPESPS
jgi:purine-binding chemotaxis protein CheW